MSGGGAKRGFAARAGDVVGLAAVAGVLYASVRFAPTLGGEAAKSGALIAVGGFLLLAGMLTSKILEVIGLPHLTGYLLAGVVAGPHVLHLIDHDTAKRLGAVNTLAIALIALAGGAELRLASLRQGLKTLLGATVVQTVLVMAASTAAFYFMRPSFVRGMPDAAIFGVGLVWGVCSITRSPAALLAVLSQTRAHGPLARFSLAFIMSSDVVVVVSLACVITIARPLVDPGATLSFDAFRALGHEVLGSIAMGTSLGLVLAAYLKLIGRQLLVVLVALGYGATEVLHYVGFEPLLSFIVAGFVVQNLSSQGEKFLHAIESTGEVVYVLFFAAAGAELNIPLLAELWPAALVFTGVRAASTYFGNTISMRMTNAEPVLKKWGWASLVSQAGVAIGIAHAAARQFPSFGPAFRDIAIACVGINEVVGPVLFKLALDRAGETKQQAVLLADGEEATREVASAVGEAVTPP